jgi:hypothetical protein
MRTAMLYMPEWIGHAQQTVCVWGEIYIPTLVGKSGRGVTLAVSPLEFPMNAK